jgi:hypothetical protein
MDSAKPGNFVAFLNRDKQPGDKRPTFEGRLAIPGTETEHRFALWAHEYWNEATKGTQIMFNGAVQAAAHTDAPMAQVAALINGSDEIASLGNIDLKPHQLVLFPNKFKDEAPDKERPDYWGAYNPGNGDPIIRISAWARKDRSQNAMFSGATSYPIPGKSEAEMQAEAALQADMTQTTDRQFTPATGGRDE